jgi:hypothetical protein
MRSKYEKKNVIRRKKRKEKELYTVMLARNYSNQKNNGIITKGANLTRKRLSYCENLSL